MEAAARRLPVLTILKLLRRKQKEIQQSQVEEDEGDRVRRQLIMAAIPNIATFLGFDVGAWLAAVGLPAWGREVDLQQRFFLALSTSGAALQGWLAARGLMNQDERNANRYAATASNLDALAERPLDEARVAAARDDAASVRTFIALVQEQISSEHREWVDLRSIAPALSLERLKEQSLLRLE